MVIATLALTPVAGILSRVGTACFARAAWPGQMVALATRSSLATLPTLVGTAKSRLGLPDRVIGFGLPFAASTFKPSNLISSPGRPLFLSWVYAIPIDPLGYVMFVGYAMLVATTVLVFPARAPVWRPCSRSWHWEFPWRASFLQFGRGALRLRRHRPQYDRLPRPPACCPGTPRRQNSPLTPFPWRRRPLACDALNFDLKHFSFRAIADDRDPRGPGGRRARRDVPATGGRW